MSGEIRNIVISADKFEHLLNCLCSQKFIGEQSKEVQRDWQEIIDKAYHEARGLLSIPKVFSDFYIAWNFLEEHKIYRDKKYNFSHFQRLCLDITVVKVNPVNDAIDSDESLNTKTQIWLESGSYEDEHGQGCHDYDLDSGADTFEEAIIELANLVYKKFGA